MARYALVVVTNYKPPQQEANSLPPLDYAEADGDLLATVLAECHYEVVPLKGSDATKAAVEAVFTSRCLRPDLPAIEPSDQFFFYFGGHGECIGGAGYYLHPHGAQPGRTGSSISMNDLSAMLRNDMPASQCMCVLDACRDLGDRGARGSSALADPASRDIEKLKVSAPGKKVDVLFGCSMGERSWEDEGVRHGLLSYHFAAAIRAEAGAGLTFRRAAGLTVDGLHQFLRAKGIDEEHPRWQTPELRMVPSEDRVIYLAPRSSDVDAEPVWRKVELDYDEDKTQQLRSAAVVSPKKVLNRRSQVGLTSTRLRLDITTQSRTRRILLLSKKEVSFGRSRRACDIGLVLLPVTPENRALSKQISGSFDKRSGRNSPPHMVLRLTRNGMELADSSRCGTFVDGILLGRGNARRLGRVSKLSIAEALDMEIYVVGRGDGLDPDDYEVLVLGGVFKDATAADVAAVVVNRADNFTEESYLVVYAGACLGDSPGSAVRVAGAGLAPRHLLILHLGDGFYVENVSGEADGVWVNGMPLEPERIEPIQSGNIIEAASARIEVGEFEQLRPMG